MKNRIPNLGAMLVAGLLAAGFSLRAEAQDVVTAITNAKIMTVGPLGNIEKGTILIKGGKITAVGADVAVPQGATIIDASGRVVTPGLIDAHSHTAVEDSVNECTNIVTNHYSVILGVGTAAAEMGVTPALLLPAIKSSSALALALSSLTTVDASGVPNGVIRRDAWEASYPALRHILFPQLPTP